MSTRGKEFKKDKRDKFGNPVPKVKIPKIYLNNYKFQRNK